jgi:hypothetical protein
MQLREFHLIDGVGIRRVQLYQKSQGESIVVMLDGVTIGSINRYEDFVKGYELLLLDGSKLIVQLINKQVSVSHNGYLLPTVPTLNDVQLSAPHLTAQKGKNQAIAGLVLGIVSCVLCLLSLFLLPIVATGEIRPMLLGIIEIPIALVGCILSVLGLRASKGMAIWGLVLSIMGLLPLCLFLLLLLIAIMTKSS